MQHEQFSIKVDLPQETPTKINVSDFGAKSEKGFCNTDAFNKAIDAVRQLGGGTVIVPKGIYHFYSAPENRHIPIEHIKDLTIDGQDSTFIFHTPVAYFTLRDAERIRLTSFTMDWAWDENKLSSVGVVKRISEDRTEMDIAFLGSDPPKEGFDIRIVGPFDPKRYTPGVEDGVEFRPYVNKHIKYTGDPVEDEKMRKLVRELDQIFVDKPIRINDRLYRFYLKDPKLAKRIFKIGQCYNFRHFEYDGVAVLGRECSHITFDKLTIHGCPGHGFLLNGFVSHLHFNNCRIMPKPGTDRSVSVSVDCLHVGNSNGNILIENCDFSGAGDDCINLHDNSSMGVRRVDDNSLIALRCTKENLQYRIGSIIEFRNSDLSPMNYKSEVIDCAYNESERTCQLTFKDPLPEILPNDTVLFHRSFGTDRYIIRNCRFTNNRARGILLQGSYGLVENNIFENIQGAAIQIETGCESRWSEGQGVHDLTIRNNVIRHCDLNAWQMAVLYMGVYLPGGRTDYPVFTNIEVCDNTFVDCPRLAAFFSSCSEVEMHDNAIINSAQLDYTQNTYGSSNMEEPIYGERYEGVIQFMYAKNCKEYDNLIVNYCDKN
ncbi:MAG: right-handed parallel beta-helix repeat-containing protein [Eubacteriales bacterium]|nr:right-handed parallel beta-helix repeat-containing protein [Eubacteriales bacterium]